jgi:integrase
MADMGRTRQKDKHLPEHLYRKGKRYYYYGGAGCKWIALGGDYAVAIERWRQYEQPGSSSQTDATFGQVAQRYQLEILPSKAPRTQRDNLAELKLILPTFRDALLSEIKPVHIRQYLDARGRVAKIRANREKALISHIWNKAREWGYTELPNPCAGIKGYREEGRDRYVEDVEYRAVYEYGDSALQDAMDLAYWTGQREADILKLAITAIKDGALWIKQGKTKKPLRIEISGELARVIDRIKARPAKIKSLALIHDAEGQPLTYGKLRYRFERAREKAGVDFQFRDLRAKAATDADGLSHAQKLLGHKSRQMTEHYTRNRAGELVKPITARLTADLLEKKSGK